MPEPETRAHTVYKMVAKVGARELWITLAWLIFADQIIASSAPESVQCYVSIVAGLVGVAYVLGTFYERAKSSASP